MNVPDTGAPSMPRLAQFWSEPAFAIGGVEFQSIDVALSAMARGDWSAFERQLAEGLACAANADARRSGPSAEALDAAGIAFRYAHDLISAAEMNDWLERRGLSVDEWTECLRRDLLRQALHDTIDDVLDRDPPSARHLIAAAVAEGLCSGSFDAFETSFAGRAALADDIVAPVAALAGVPSESHDAAASLIHTNAHWLSIWPARDLLDRAHRVLAIEAAYAAAVGRLVTEAPLADVVERYRMEWVVIETDTLVFPTEHAAREAVLCVTDEQLSLQDVANLSRRTATRQSRFADEMDDDVRDRLLSVDEGGVMGPTAVNGGFEVTRVVSRAWPSADYPRIAERARLAVVDVATERAMRERVTRQD